MPDGLGVPRAVPAIDRRRYVTTREEAAQQRVHGFAGRWLVNGSGEGILALDLEPAQQARVLGVPVRLRQLLVSVDDPDALAERLGKRA